MNKMHQIAKITLVTLAIYLIVKLLPSLFMGGYAIFMDPSLETIGVSIASLVLTALYIWLLIHFLVIKRDKLAKKIVGETDTPTLISSAAWLPVAYRLAFTTAGLIMLYGILWNMTYQVAGALLYSPDIEARTRFLIQTLQRNSTLLILLPLAIYLLCGAPHFVRWQVKKTLAICSEFSENEVAIKSNDLQTGE